MCVCVFTCGSKTGAVRTLGCVCVRVLAVKLSHHLPHSGICKWSYLSLQIQPFLFASQFFHRILNSNIDQVSVGVLVSATYVFTTIIIIITFIISRHHYHHHYQNVGYCICM